MFLRGEGDPAMLTDLDKLPEANVWVDVMKEAKTRLAQATDLELALELRNPSTNTRNLLDATLREALARILERKQP
jgi:hypothetical protein